jgi:hypothetical protein
MARAFVFDGDPFINDYAAGDWSSFDTLSGPTVPPPRSYVVPRREVEEDDLIVTRIRENQICSLFRQDGFREREKMYIEQEKYKALDYLRWWRDLNQHIPSLFLMEGTREHEPPVDALLAAIIQDVDMGDGEYGGVDYRFEIVITME